MNVACSKIWQYDEWFDWPERKMKNGLSPRVGEHGARKWMQLLDSNMFNHAEVPIFPFQFLLLAMWQVDVIRLEHHCLLIFKWYRNDTASRETTYCTSLLIWDSWTEEWKEQVKAKTLGPTTVSPFTFNLPKLMDMVKSAAGDAWDQLQCSGFHLEETHRKSAKREQEKYCSLFCSHSSGNS